MNPKLHAFLIVAALAFASAAPGQKRLGDETIELDAFVVAGSPFAITKEDLIAPASALSGDALRRAARSSLGATLDGKPGVHSTYFGPGAGRPVIRGFDGDRVRILNSGTDSFDVSQTSPDHGVSIEPLFAESVEVVRGPASLLYGNAAIGGVVNVIGKEMPRGPAPAPVSGELQASYGSVADERSVGLALLGGAPLRRGGARGDFAWSAGYLDRASGDHEIPGFAESAYQREAEEAEHHGEVHDDEEHADEARGVLENSFVDTRTGYIGAGLFGERASLGLSASRFETAYGVPGHAHEHEDEHEEDENVSIDLEQTRYSLRAALLEPGDFLESVELQIGYGGYQHIELEGDEIGTVFERDGYELRLTGVHNPIGSLTGAIGLHVRDESFDAAGEEAFIPANDMRSRGVFLVERLDREWGAWEFGGRLESVKIEPDSPSLRGRRFAPLAASAGFLRRVAEGSTVAANLGYAERAPNATELYALGPHVGTRSFEIGDAALGKERSVNLDASYRRSVGFVTGEFTAFVSAFDDYVYLRSLDPETVESLYGELDTHGLNVLQASAVEARFYGFELDLRFHLLDAEDRRAHFDLLIDQTRATNETSDTNLPRIPTRRVGGRYEFESGPWLLGVEGRYHYAASRLAPNELPTDDYFLWGADARYRIQATDTAVIDLFVVATNLGNEEARAHTSFLKDLAPMPGRDVSGGLRTSF